MKNIIVGQSGGPTAVINSSLYGVISEGIAHSQEIGTVYGMIHGIEGFLSDQYMDLKNELSTEDLEVLKATPAAYLGSCRFKLPEDLNSQVYRDLFAKLDALDIGYFFYIGGNDSMDTVSKLSRCAACNGSSIRFIGIPKTIDNDLVMTDHTPGFGSAAKYVASTVREISLDACVYQQPSVVIIELMGRHAGWITAASVLARKFEGDNPLLVYLPESPFSMEQFSKDLTGAFKRSSTVVVCVSEGIADSEGKFICEYSSEASLDTFGHKMLTGCGKVLESYIKTNFGVKVRAVELNVSQRCSGMVVSRTDIKEAAMAGSYGVRAALEGATGQMVAFNRVSDRPYRMECGLVDVNEVCNREKTFPNQWIISGGADISNEFLDYVMPLIQGEVERKMENGLPVYGVRR